MHIGRHIRLNAEFGPARLPVVSNARWLDTVHPARRRGDWHQVSSVLSSLREAIAEREEYTLGTKKRKAAKPLAFMWPLVQLFDDPPVHRTV